MSKMHKLKELKLAECNISDRGIIEVINALDEIGTVDAIDLSGN